MVEPRLFLCSDATIPKDDGRRDGFRVVQLNSMGPRPNINLKVEDVAKVFAKHLSPRLTDLLEVATYVYSGDCATNRGSAWVEGARESWDRRFRFVIPVRDVQFWQRQDVQDLLRRILLFLSNDDVSFDFCKLETDRPKQEYLEFGSDDNWPFHEVERVVMFSGGLDSLAGAVDTACKGDNLVLVSHRTVAPLYSRQKKLHQQVKEFCTKVGVETLHVPVWINKSSSLGQESTQRTRSFLYSSLGTVVAASVGAKGVRFFENGVVSMNWPVADEALRARASQTTHPSVLKLLSDLFTLVLERPVEIDNPYVLKTKKEVIEVIRDRGASTLIGHTCSCAHTAFKSKTQWHCGTCSQCIDRRVAMLAAGQEEFDSATDYVSDVFIGPRAEGYEQNMAVNFARHALELSNASEEKIASNFNREIARAVRYMPNAREAASEIIAMHQRHAETVLKVLHDELTHHSTTLVNGALNKTSMLAKIAGQEHLVSTWKSYADTIARLLTKGLPVACEGHKPKDEPHLQQICDGIIKARNSELIREYPFMRWSSSKTKPDWSIEELHLWIELKYVRQKSDIRQITEDIASDITKYGDNGRRVLYVIYDPNHLIMDESEFIHPIESRPTMQVAFIR